MGVMLMGSMVTAFDPPIAKVGDFTMRIDAPQIVTQLETPIQVRIHLDNAGTQTLKGKVRLKVIDRWKVTSANPQSFELPPKSEKVLEFSVVAGKGTHNAHYPIHAFAEWDGGRGTRDERMAHAVLVVEVRAPREPKLPKETVVRLPERGSVPLWQQGNHQVSFQVFGQPMQTMPRGWWGTDEATGAHTTLQRVDRGGTKDAIAIHPPWRKGAGTIFVDWEVEVPKTKPIFLDFAFAIRDHDPQREPPSDGVTVRVWVKPINERKQKSAKTERKQTGRDLAVRGNSSVIPNPIQSRQIHKLLPLQKPEQFFVGSPISCPDLLSDNQVNRVVVTDTPTQSSIENFLGIPINFATVDNHLVPKMKESGKGSQGNRASFSNGFNQSTQNFVFKSVGNMRFNSSAINVHQHFQCRLTNFFRLIQQDCSQENRSIYDGNLAFHPLAISLRLSNSLKASRPLNATFIRHQRLNSSSLICPALKASNIFATSSFALSSSSWMVANSKSFRFATVNHLSQPLCHLIAFDGGGAPKKDGDDEWQLLYENHSDSKVWVPARVDLSQFAGQRIEVHLGPKNDTTCDMAHRRNLFGRWKDTASLRNFLTCVSSTTREDELFGFATLFHLTPPFYHRDEKDFPSLVTANPSHLGQIHKLLPLQKPEQFFVSSPISCPDLLSNCQVDGIVVTNSPTKRRSQNFLCLPVNATMMNGGNGHKVLQGDNNGVKSRSQWSPFSEGFNQTSKNFVLKPVRNVCLYRTCVNAGNHDCCWQADVHWFIQQNCRQKHRSVHDDFFLCFEFRHHPLANSLRFRKLSKTPLPLMPNRDHHHSANSFSEISPFLSASTRRSSSASKSSLFSDGDFLLATVNHLSQPLCHLIAFDGGGAPTKDGDDGWQLLYEHHSDSKVWVPARVDLSQFAGQQIVLRIEIHPGPKNDTTCDTAFIGEPYLIAGRVPLTERTEAKVDERLRLMALVRWQMVQVAEKWGLLPKDFQTRKQLIALQLIAPIAQTTDEFKRANEMAMQLLKRIKVSPKQKPLSLFVKPVGTQPAVWVVLHDGEFFAYALQQPSQNGWWDALGTIVFADRELFFDGFDVRVLGDNLSDWRSPSVLLSRSEKVEGNRLIATHRMERNGVPYTLTMLAWSEGGTLKVRWQLSTTAPQDRHQPLRITDCSLRSWSEQAERIYIGHGNVIVRPRAFRLHADGHFLSTRHAGIDFANGISAVVGVDNPPDFFECQPATRHYSIHAHMDVTFTIATSSNNVWQAANRYREIDPYKPAPTLAKLAGRFVFDLWGGWRYAWVAEQLEKAFKYGCTDALVIYHNWQRWGYDYRLPDIFPPNPQFGTLEDFVKMVEVCNRFGVLFALHDNYIDFYPDAEGYSYRHICFTPDGNPVRAWFNEWRQAQSYRWRPDAFFPFMERNLKLIAKHIKPTAYFVDVFSSIRMFDWWTEDGEFHSVLETQKRWGEAFNFIRNILGGAPQTSESGCDWLIGWLDGATTNHLRVDPKAPPGQWSVWRIQCEDAERIPWFDFAHHHKFALHGAGYSNRYQGGLPYEVAGIYSDDYICTEVLTGHPAMVSEPFGAQVVRKYWLLAELGRALALAQMASVDFADGDIHRQIVRWQLAPHPLSRVPRPTPRVPLLATVWVNRSEQDWHIVGRTLPSFGFYAQVGNVRAAIEKLPTTDGSSVIAEWALSERYAYCNARTKVLFGWTPIQLVGVEVRWLGNRRFELTLRWKADKPTEEPHHVFIHFTNPKSQRGEQIAFQGDHAPDIPTTQWQGEIVTKTVVTVPQQWGADRYGVRIGLWNPKTGYRLRLMGDVDDTLRLVAGDLVLEGEGNNITGSKLELNPNLTKTPEWLKRWNIQGKPVDFGFAVTDGAFRFDRKTLTLTPLPDHEPFTVTLRLDKLLGKAMKISAVEALDENGKVISSVPFKQRDGEVTFKTQIGVFAYRLVRVGERK